MAIKLFQKLFARKKDEPIVMTAAEAFKPAPETPAPEEPAPQAPETAPEPAPEPAPETPAPETPAPETTPEETSEETSAEVPEEAPEEAPAEEEKPAEQPPADPSLQTWIYACLDDTASIALNLRPSLIAQFSGVSEDEKGISGTLPSGGKVQATINADAADVRELAGYVKSCYADTFLSDRDVQNAAMMQIELFNVVVELTMPAPFTAEDERAFAAAALAVAQPMRGFVLNPGFELRRWDGKLLISQDGRTDFTVFMPIRRGVASAGSGQNAAVDAARQKRSNEILHRHGIPMDCTRPVQVHEADARLRTPEEIVGRVAALVACALKAQAFTSPRDVATPAAWVLNAVKRLEAQYGVNRLFTGKEMNYIVRAHETNHGQYLLRFESCAVLLWALGLCELNWPSQPADVETILRVIRDGDTQSLLRAAHPRPLGEILNMHDMIFRLHSLCVREKPEFLKDAAVDHDIVYERHYALNWLLAVDGISDWDMVVPKT